jgi:hypothetical protein
MESLSFQHYLETQKLISYSEAHSRLAELGGDGGPVSLSYEDYILGVFDMVGELMRFAITAMATHGTLPSGSSASATHASVMREGGNESKHPDAESMAVDEPHASQRTVLSDLRELRVYLESLEVGPESHFAKDVEKKMTVMRECVEKVEKSLYGLIVRGRERPKGWMPDIRSERPQGAEIET